MTYEQEVEEAKKYVREKLVPASCAHSVPDLYRRSLLGVSWTAFVEAIGAERQVWMTDGREPLIIPKRRNRK